MLVETRWLKEEVDHLESNKMQERARRGSGESSQIVLETLLTVSEDSVYVE